MEIEKKDKAMIYENMLSGAFIYSLGLMSGKRAAPEQNLVDSINFYQQTPYDKPIADIMAKWDGKTFILEFKKDVKSIDDEFKKPHKKLLLETLRENPEMLKISERLHFMCYGVEHANRIDIQYYPYAHERLKYGEKTSDFIEEIFAENSEIGIGNLKDIAKYIAFLLKFSKLSDVDALITNVSAGGVPNFIRVKSFRQLELSLNQIKGQSLDQQQQNIQTPKKSLGLGLGY